MIHVELIAKVRRLFFAEHWKIGTITSQLGLHPDTVRSAIESHRFNPERTPSFRKTLPIPISISSIKPSSNIPACAPVAFMK